MNELKGQIEHLKDRLQVLQHPEVQAIADVLGRVPSITEHQVIFRITQYSAPEVACSYEELVDQPTAYCNSSGVEAVFEADLGQVGHRRITLQFEAWADYPADVKETLRGIGKLKTITPEEQIQHFRSYEALTC